MNRNDAGAVTVASTVHPAPAIGARAAAVISRSSGQVLYESRVHERLAPASTTKIMTAVIALESIEDEAETIVTATDASRMTGSSVMGLWPTATVTYRDLLFGLMLPSGNDAALELARHDIFAVAGPRGNIASPTVRIMRLATLDIDDTILT